MAFYRAFCFFFLYAFLGWTVEVVYAAVTRGEFVNRGFLNGPVCPIYGIGMVAVIALLSPVKDKLFLLILASIFLTTALELVTGFLMEKIFHHRWWDYSKEPFNLGGYICLKFSLLWGFACAFVVSLLHPMIEKLVNLMPLPLGIVLLSLFSLLLICDLVLTLLKLIRLERELRSLYELGQLLHGFSDRLGGGLAKGTLRITETGRRVKGELDEKAEALREHSSEKWEALKKRRDLLEEKTEKSFKRLLRAFPQLRSVHYREELDRIRERLSRKNEKTPKEEKKIDVPVDKAELLPASTDVFPENKTELSDGSEEPNGGDKKDGI